MMILASWIADSFHVQFVPRSVHDSVADSIDSMFNRLPSNSVTPDVDSIVAHNPLDDSPITFGSVILLGVVCGVGLLALGITSTQRKVN
jgi:hypothetical protein